MTDFFAIQTQTGWGQVLRSFANWCRPHPGWTILDVGCGPGLLPVVFARRGCLAFGADRAIFAEPVLHSQVLAAEAARLPFPGESFDLVTATNLLFLLEDPRPTLLEMGRLLRPRRQICLLNPSEHMSLAAAVRVAEERGLEGVARRSLFNWARQAEDNHRWTEADLEALCASAGLSLVETALRVGPGLARYARIQANGRLR
jgi:ubiquinone/menaquinone biosynthesis C-methylase UbiE